MRRLREILMPEISGGLITRAMIWTSLAGIVYAGSSFVIIILATRWTGDYWAGILGLGLAMSQQLYALGNFSTGGYHASDVAEVFSFPEYVSSKVVTVLAMFPAAAAWIWLGGYNWPKSAVFLLLLAQRASECLCSVFTYRYQQKGRLDVGGRIELTKNTLSLVVFCLCLAATRDIYVSAGASALVHIALYFALDRVVLDAFGGLRFILPTKRVWRLTFNCLPLAATTFLLSIISIGTKIAVEKILGAEGLAVFNALIMISFVIPTAANFILAPHIVSLGEARDRGDAGKLFRFVGWQSSVIVAAGIVGVVFAGLCGTQILSWLFGMDLSPYKTELCLLVAGGVMLALYQLMQAMITVMRKQGWSLVGVLPAVSFMVLTADAQVRSGQLMGASKCFFFSTLILLSMFSVLATVPLLRMRGTVTKKGRAVL